MKSLRLQNLLKMKTSSKGLSLLELLIAFGILAFALCAILFVYALCSVLITTSRNINIATNASLGLMEEIRTSSFSNITTDYNNLTFTLNDIPSSKGIVYVDDSNPELLLVTISVCWLQGQRVIGEDKNLDGVLSLGEDINHNDIIDSTVQLVTRIANK